MSARHGYNPPVRDLRDLGDKLVAVTTHHFCAAQALPAVLILRDYLCAMARIEEQNREMARILGQGSENMK